MTIISHSNELSALCRTLQTAPFITIDTEFLRDKTYYPRLCLIQMAGPGIGPVAVDPLTDGLDLGPIIDLLRHREITKVFHAARQDLEIFYNIMGEVPGPLFDTQVAAMVCGHGDQIGYTNLVRILCGRELDKGAQFTDWSRRPLSSRQLSYALDDVTYLRDVYKRLSADLAAMGRERWVDAEMAILTDPATYQNPPEDAWRRIKLRSARPRTLAILRELCAWREREAQRRDVPRNRIVRDETLADMAVHEPKTVEELARIRGIGEDMARGRLGAAIIDAIKRGLAVPDKDCPRLPRREQFPADLTPALEMLKMLLRIQCAAHGVAPKLVADTEDLEALAFDENADIPAVKGWRYEVFGRAAQDLLQGRLGLSLKDGKINVSEIPA